MNEEVLYFFDKHPDALPLYETFERKVRGLVPDVLVKVQKTQISFYNKHNLLEYSVYYQKKIM